MHAGKPDEEERYRKKDVEGITFYIRNEMMNRAYQIKWIGFWILGGFVVQEI